MGFGCEAADAAAANMSSPDVGGGGVIMGSLVTGLSVRWPGRSRGGGVVKRDG